MTLARDDGEKVSYGEEEASMKHHQAADQYQVIYQYQYQYQVSQQFLINRMVSFFIGYQ